MSTTAQSTSSPAGRHTWKVAGASLVGTTFEWYDFAIFATAAALVFPGLFFPTSEPTVGTMATFATFAVGFVARPLGGIVLSHFGDRVGRRSVLVFTLVLMGFCVVAIGLLPTFADVGIAAPLCLVILRVTQGFAVGGEWAGAILLAFEHAPGRRRGFFGSVPLIGPTAGALLGSLAFFLVNLLPEPELLAWGWRIPFLAGGVIVIIGLVLRLSISESREFASVERTHFPIAEVLRTHRRQIALVIGVSVGYGVSSYIYVTYLLNHATKALGVPSSTMLLAMMITNVGMIAAIPVWGHLSDRYGRLRIFLAGTAVVGLGTFLAPPLLRIGTFGSILVLYLVVLGIGVSATTGCLAALSAEAFDTNVRYTGISLGYQLAQVLAGLSPLVFTLLQTATGSIWVVPAVNLLLGSASAWCAWLLVRSR